MLYDITKSFEENITYGPFWTGEFPTMPKSKRTFSLLGKKINSLFGVSACPLTHGYRNVWTCSYLGFDIITYRSVRSIEWHGQPYPHWRYVDAKKQLSVDDLPKGVKGSDKSFGGSVSMANSLGIQSLKPEYWQMDFEIAKQLLSPKQLLILALMFTPETGKDVTRDAALLAQYANETSADVFEINLAHPNSGMKSLVYEDVETSVGICRAVKKALKGRPLLAKIGYYKDPSTLEEFIKRAPIDGISSTNTYGMPVSDGGGGEVFPGRPKAGVSGEAIRSLSMEQASRIVDIKKKFKRKDFVVVGIGGVLKPAHIDGYLKLGVDAVQSAVGVFEDPLLAYKYKKLYL